MAFTFAPYLSDKLFSAIFHVDINETKIMALGRTESIRSKISINNRVLEQTIAFDCLLYNVSHDSEKVLKVKTKYLSKCWKIKGSSSKSC
jgi:hypothetical protein